MNVTPYFHALQSPGSLVVCANTANNQFSVSRHDWRNGTPTTTDRDWCDLTTGSMNQNGDIQASTAGFSPLKVFLSINGNGVNSQDIRLLHAQPDFFAAFGYSPSDLPMSLVALLSVDGEQEIVTSMVSALLAGLQGSYFIGLRSRSNAAVPCHVTLSTGGCVTMNVSAERSDITRRFAILTIRSATVASLAGAAMSAP